MTAQILVRDLVPGDTYETPILHGRKASHLVLTVEAGVKEVTVWTLRYLPGTPYTEPKVSDVCRTYAIDASFKLLSGGE